MKNMMILIAAAALASVSIACSGGDIRLDVTPSVEIHYFDRPGSQTPTIDSGAYFDMVYVWKVKENFNPVKTPLRAFVHFRDETGNLILLEEGKTLQDDHDFEKPVKDWKAGESVIYARKRMKFDENLGSRNFRVNMYVGIYNPEDNRRAELTPASGEPPGNRAYLVATFNIQKNPKIYPIYNDTWNGPELPPNQKHIWAKQVSEVTFQRDRQAATVELWFSGHSPVEDFPLADTTPVGTEPKVWEQRMWIYVHERKPEFLVVPEPLVFTAERVPLTQILIPRELYETYNDRDIKIIFEVDKILSPGEGDGRRELGFKILEMLLQPKN